MRSAPFSGKNLGILGGSFDPIHNGHLNLAREISARTGLDRVLFIPAGCPPHKAGGQLASKEHRAEMVRLALEPYPELELSRIELEAEGTTYTVDTLRKLRTLLPDAAELHFIIGADTVLDLLNWKESRAVFALCAFIAAARPGWDETGVRSQVRLLEETHGARIRLVEIPPLAVSSTEIRSRIRRGEPIRGLVPEAVAEYIGEHGLYGGHK